MATDRCGILGCDFEGEYMEVARHRADREVHPLPEKPPEPPKMGALVRDNDGHVWKRGRTRWTCLTPVDGVRVTQVGRLPWYALVARYGPLTEVRR